MSVQEIQTGEVLANAAAPSLWSSIRESVRGSHQDFTSGSLNRAILLLAIPMAYFLAMRAGMQANGVSVSIVIAECAIAGAGVVLFRRGRWKGQKI